MNRQFPALRGIAIILVIINHSIALSLLAAREAGLASPPTPVKIGMLAIKELGILAVPTFLFLAGTFFVYAVQGKDIKQSYKLVWPGLSHTIWPYLIWSVVFYGMVFLLRNETYSLTEYLKNLAVGYPYNFVPLLIAFYLVAPILVFVSRRWPWLVLALFGLYQLFLIFYLRPEILGFTFPDLFKWIVPPVFRIPLAIWGLFYPMGVVYSLHQAKILPWLHRFKWPIALITLGLFVLAVLHDNSLITFPLAELLCPIFAVLLFPVIRRDSIPAVKTMEKAGKRSYGLYLLNLIVINLILAAVTAFLPGLYALQPLLALGVMAITYFVPMVFMSWVERLPGRVIYRYLFG